MPDAFTQALSLALDLTSPALLAAPAPGSTFELFTAPSTERVRMAQQRFLWDMYRGEQLTFIPRLPGESTLEFLRRPHKCALNFTRVLVDILSQLYRRPVERTLEGDAGAVERIQRALSRNPLDRLLLTCDRLARLQGVAALRVSYEQGELRFWPWPAHRLAVLPQPQQPDRPAAVVALPAGAADVAHVWTAERFACVAAGRVADEQEHGYGCIPFVFAHDRLPVDGFWVEGRGHAVAPANAEFNAKLSELAHTIAMQGFGVMEIVNPDPAQDIAVGPGRAIRFTVSGNEPYGISFKSPQAPVAELLQDLEFFLRALLKSQRIPESVLSVHATSGQSGVAILAQQTPVLEDRVERRQVFAAFEHELLACALALLREHEGLRGACSLRVDFPEPELEQSASERMQMDDWRLRRGLATPWELMRRDDPDAWPDLESARAAWLANRDALREAGLAPEINL
ncbi:MAG: hypothetical protein IT463_06025 [Planctomycetes bacterium]|nr:hypothetical protein [Planctomycetota bacterium]